MMYCTKIGRDVVVMRTEEDHGKVTDISLRAVPYTLWLKYCKDEEIHTT